MSCGWGDLGPAAASGRGHPALRRLAESGCLHRLRDKPCHEALYTRERPAG